MRCDGNVSLRRRGSTKLGVKTELKNMNSFKNLHDGLAYEICRQAEVLEEGGQIYQETRHWDPTMKHTIVMRVKETADDYRLFPEPDLAPYDLSDEFIEGVRVKLPSCPTRRPPASPMSSACPPTMLAHLVDHRATADFFEACMEDCGQGCRQAGEACCQPDHQRRHRMAERQRGCRPCCKARSRPPVRWSCEAARRGRHLVQAGQAGVLRHHGRG